MVVRPAKIIIMATIALFAIGAAGAVVVAVAVAVAVASPAD